jgi:hypothetical protein
MPRSWKDDDKDFAMIIGYIFAAWITLLIMFSVTVFVVRWLA